MFIFHNCNIWLEASDTLLFNVGSFMIDTVSANVSETAVFGGSGILGEY